MPAISLIAPVNQVANVGKNLQRAGMIMLATMLALGALGWCYHRFCNHPRHSPEWIAARIDASIERGLNSLHRSAAFIKPYAEGGDSPVHHFLIEQILRRQDHEGLRLQLALARKLNATDGEWRKYYGLPGWPREALSEQDRQRIQSFVAEVRNLYTAWILHALYPDWTQLPPRARELLLVHPEKLPLSSDLAHAEFALYLLKRLWPQTARELQADTLIARIDDRLEKLHRWAPRCGDSYQLRLAVWLLNRESAAISPRWVERTIVNQNRDGGWAWIPGYIRVAREMFGADSFSDDSAPHPTFLAVLALTLYREQMRAAGTYPAKPAN